MCLSQGMLTAVTVIITALSFASQAHAGDKISVGHRWPAGEQISADRVGHGSWDALVQKYVDRLGYVDYKAWKASTADVRDLDAYLAALSRVSPKLRASREAKLAFWINAYNAVTIKGILREYPTSSIRNHTAKLFGYNIWDDLLLTVGNGQYSLNQIEHEVLRKAGDPRIHFAIVCASISCPKLINRAYTAQAVDEQLTTNARAFFADRSKFNYDARASLIHVSPILDWFAEDFGSTRVKQMATIAPYLPDASAQRLANSGTARVSYLQYDWGLNDQAKRPRTSNRQ